MPITSVIFVSRHSTQTENYGSRRRNLDYFRKCRTPARKKQARITEVEARMPITSVKFVSRHSTQTENYGSRRRNLDYFRKCRTPARKKQARITEVEAKMPITSVKLVSRHSTQTENYGSRRRNLDYFRKCCTPARKSRTRLRSKRKNPVYFRNLLLQGQATMLAWSSDPPIKVESLPSNSTPPHPAPIDVCRI